MVAATGKKVGGFKRDAKILATNLLGQLNGVVNGLRERSPVALLRQRNIRSAAWSAARLPCDILLAMQHYANQPGSKPFCEVQVCGDIPQHGRGCAVVLRQRQIAGDHGSLEPVSGQRVLERPLLRYAARNAHGRGAYGQSIKPGVDRGPHQLRCGDRQTCLVAGSLRDAYG